MRNFMSLLAILALLASCSGNSPSEECEGVSGCDGDVSTNLPKNLQVEIQPVYFYLEQSQSWAQLEPDLNGDLFMGTVPIYSHQISLPLEDAIGLARASQEQFENQDGISASEYNTLPYIKVRAREGVRYQFNYIKKDASGEIVAEMVRDMPIRGDFAYLPLVNEAFGGKMQSTSLGSGSVLSFQHYVRVTANSDNAAAADIKQVSFRLDPQVQTRDVLQRVHAEMEDFSLPQRWRFYFDGSDGLANSDLDFASLVDNQQSPETVPYDIQFIFKERPRLKIRQRSFVEETVDLELLRATGIVLTQRGASFYVEDRTFDSHSDFGSRIKISQGGQSSQVSPVAGSNGTAFIQRNLNPLEPWELTFAYDLSSAPGRNGVPLLDPLGTPCSIIDKETPMLPLKYLRDKEEAEAAGGRYFLCHPDQHGPVAVEAGDPAANSMKMYDQWHGFFSYRPDEELERRDLLKVVDAGHFYGLQEVEFEISGCLRILVREAYDGENNPYSWKRKNPVHAECTSAEDVEQNPDAGYMYFSVSKRDNIYNHRGELEVPEALQTRLRSLIESLSTKAPKRRPGDFFFNGKMTTLGRIN